MDIYYKRGTITEKISNFAPKISIKLWLAELNNNIIF